MLIVLLVVALLVAVGGFPAWPHARTWGYYPSGVGFLLAVILLVLIFRAHPA